MSEQNSKPPTQYFLISLIVILIAIVGFQTWYLMCMKKQLDFISYRHHTATKISTSASTATSTLAEASPVADEIKTPAPQPLAESSNALTEVDQSTTAPQAQQIDPTPLPDDAQLNQPYYGQNGNLYAAIDRMQRDMDRAFNNHSDPSYRNPNYQHHFSYNFATPEMNVQEDAANYIVRINLPGVDKKSIAINLEGQRLTVKAEQQSAQQEKDAVGKVIFQEHHSGRFQRSITLQQPVKNQGMKTRMDNGVLSIMIPKQ